MIRVIDGDTVKIDYNGEATNVRLIGVDTPETVHPSKPVEAYGKEASQFYKESAVRRVGLSAVRYRQNGQIWQTLSVSVSGSGRTICEFGDCAAGVWACLYTVSI